MARTARRLPPDHPDALALLAAMAREYPAWDGGWSTGGDTFVALYEEQRPVAGAVIEETGEGLAAVSRICVPAAAHGHGLGHELVAALEATARERGCTRLRLDSTAFLLRSEVPYDDFQTGPPYDGDTDVEVWAEKYLR